jgi:serine phosphatase RsbU (regulator of sigma subunit)
MERRRPARIMELSPFATQSCPCSQHNFVRHTKFRESCTGIGLAVHTGRESMRKWARIILRQSKSLLLAEGLLFVTLFGLADYATGEELFFLEFYLIPVLLVTWCVSEQAGILISLASGIFWFVDDVIGRNPSGRPAISFWNLGLKLIVFLLFVRLLSSLKSALEREQEHMRNELEIARQVQQRLFPQALPPLKTLDYVGICKPVFEVGGDYYDFVPVEPGGLGVALADVSGKGISSALLMSNLQALIRSRAYQHGHHLDLLVQEINSLLFSSTDDNKYATLFYGLYEDTSQRFTYVNAGHNPPLLFRNHMSDRIEVLKASGTVVGLLPNRLYEEVTIQLNPGDVLILYTDGITEACNEQDQEFGEEQLCQFIESNLHLPAPDLAQSVLHSVQQFADPARQQDDLTLVVLKVRAI